LVLKRIIVLGHVRKYDDGIGLNTGRNVQDLFDRNAMALPAPPFERALLDGGGTAEESDSRSKNEKQRDFRRPPQERMRCQTAESGEYQTGADARQELRPPQFPGGV
jgi:hypothetical protein